MTTTTQVRSTEVTGTWDDIPSGFKAIPLTSIGVLALYALGTVFAVRAMSGIEGHETRTGLGASYLALALFLLAMAYVVTLGVALIYHRSLVHRACRVHPIIAYPLLVAALPAGTPVQWVGNHRNHHATTDHTPDRHSPVQHGFWAAHAGWYIYNRSPLVCVLYTFAGPLRMLFDAFWRPQTNQEHVDLARDIAREPFYGWVSRPAPYAFFVIGHVVVSWCFVYLLWGTNGLLPLYITQVSYYLIGDGVNSVLHMWGEKPFESRDDSRNLLPFALITLGEGYHNAHHAFPRSVRCGLLPGQLDVAYLQARLLERLGLCSDLVVPTPREILDRLRDEKHRPHFEALLAEETKRS